MESSSTLPVTVVDPCQLLASGVSAGLHDVLVEALTLDENPERIQLDALLERDLGADEVDLLDIRFKLQRKFQIEINQTLPKAGLSALSVGQIQHYLANDRGIQFKP